MTILQLIESQEDSRKYIQDVLPIQVDQRT